MFARAALSRGPPHPRGAPSGAGAKGRGRAGCAPLRSEQRLTTMQPTPSPARNSQVIRQFYDQALNRRNLALIDALFAPQVSFPGLQSARASRDQVKAGIGGQLQSLPD